MIVFYSGPLLVIYVVALFLKCLCESVASKPAKRNIDFDKMGYSSDEIPIIAEARLWTKECSDVVFNVLMAYYDCSTKEYVAIMNAPGKKWEERKIITGSKEELKEKVIKFLIDSHNAFEKQIKHPILTWKDGYACTWKDDKFVYICPEDDEEATEKFKRESGF